MLAELEDRRDADGLGAADLSGDSGAVGRLLVSGAGADAALMVDLKGAMYNVTVAPLAGTVCVVSVGTAEAKVRTPCSLLLAEWISTVMTFTTRCSSLCK